MASELVKDKDNSSSILVSTGDLHTPVVRSYVNLTSFISPLVSATLRHRALLGFDPAGDRWQEQLGFSSAARPEGPILWVHCSSAGQTVGLRQNES